jgi:hypothetical protein
MMNKFYKNRRSLCFCLVKPFFRCNVAKSTIPHMVLAAKSLLLDKTPSQRGMCAAVFFTATTGMTTTITG